MTALAGALLAASLGYGADQALAAYTANVQAGTLTVAGNGASDKLALRLQPGAPTLLQVDVGADGTADFTFDRNLFTAIDVKAGNGDDEVRIDQSGGTFVDELVTIDGGGGADTLLGASGAETFLGGGGNDFVDGNQGADRAILGGGEDTFQWDPGDGSDSVDGQGGSDALNFNGSNIGESIDVSANGSRVRFFRNIAAITMDLGTIENVNFRALGGADVVVVNDLAGTGVKRVFTDLGAFGGGGDGAADTVEARGTSGADRVTFTSPGGFPTVTGLSAEVLVEGAEEANDNVNVATLGGSDTITTGREVFGPVVYNVDGGADADVVKYNGTAGADTISVLPNGTEVSTFSPLAARLDTTAVESLVVLGLGDADTITGGNGISTLTALTIDGGDGDDALGGGDGDDTIIGGRGNDLVDGNRGNDHALLGGAGDDTVQWDPGDGSDTAEGQAGSDVLQFNGSNIGESVDVSANGARGRFFRNVAAVTMDFAGIEDVNFRALGGADVVVVNDLAGTGIKRVDTDLSAFDGGGDGAADTVEARGTSGADRVTLTSPGRFPTISGLAAEVVVDGAEEANDSVNIATLDGADTINASRELFGPAEYNVDGGADADVVRYSGTSVADTIQVLPNGGEVSTFAPLAARLDSTAVESLVVLGLGDADTIVGGNGISTLTALTIDGGEGDDSLGGGDGADTIIGGPGNDLIDGNRGNDLTLLGGAGDDTFQWDPGDGSDTAEGQAGNDKLAFNGSNIGEKIELSANAGRVRLTRDVAAITMDFDGIESVAVRTLGGADTVTVNDLAGTDTKTVDVDLNATLGGGDGAADTVVVNGTGHRDVVQVTRSGDQVSVTGLAAQTRITGSEAANDTLRVQTLDGNDDVTVAADVAGLINPVVDLGPGQ